MPISLKPMSAIVILAIVLASGWSAKAGEASNGPSADRGKTLAMAHCAPCHAIQSADESPTRTNANTAFRDLHRRFPIPMLVKALQTGTIEGHDEMPAFDFTQAEIMDLMKYIDGLAPEGAGQYLKH